MIGDKLIIKPEYFTLAHKIVEQIYKLESNLEGSADKIVIAIAGESGSGKSVAGHCLRELLSKHMQHAEVLQQDDYFKLPPKSNHEARVRSLDHVGAHEVDLAKLAADIAAFKSGAEQILKPEVNYDANRIQQIVMNFKGIKYLIVEGTYTLLLDGIDIAVFMSRDYTQTKQQRLERNRDEHSDFVEQVLSIEHEIIAKQKAAADLIVLPDYTLVAAL